MRAGYGPSRVFCLLTVGKPLYSCVGLCEHCWSFHNKTVHNCTSATSSITGLGGLCRRVCFTICAHNFAPINRQLCLSGNASNLYCGSARFISRPGQMTVLRRSMSFISLSNQIPAYYVLLRHDRFYPHSFPLIIRILNNSMPHTEGSILYWSGLKLSAFKSAYESNLSNRKCMHWIKSTTYKQPPTPFGTIKQPCIYSIPSVNTPHNIFVFRVGNFLTSWEPVSFSRSTVLHGVSKFFSRRSLTTCEDCATAR